MRIAYFANSVVPSRQANSIHVVNMAAALASLGHDVTLHAHIRPFEGEQAPAPLERIASNYGVPANFRLTPIQELPIFGRSTLAAASIALARRFDNCDLVIGRHAKACAFAALMGVPCAFETHQPIAAFPPVESGLLNFALRRDAFRALITISNPLRDILLREMPCSSRKLLVAHDGATSVDGFSPADLGDTDKLRVGYLGHLYEGRGIEVIVGLAAQCPEIEFYVIGGNYDDIQRWRSETEEQENLHFTGFLPPAIAASMRLAFDLLLAPYQPNTSVPGGHITTSWMSPLKIFEYMAAGKAIVCSDLPVLREVLCDNVNCLLVPPSDLGAWLEAVRSLATDAGLRRRLGERAREDFERNYSWEMRAARIVAFAQGNSAKSPQSSKGDVL